jgi:chromosome segregation ATPase
LIKNLEYERNKLIEMNESLKYENSNLHGVIKTKEDNIVYTQKQLEDSNKTILRLSNSLQELEAQAERLRHEINSINSTGQRETKSRIEREKVFGEIEIQLREKEKEMRICLEQLDMLTIQKEKLFEDNSKMYSEIDRLKNQIYKLSQQNTTVREVI